MIDWDKAIQAIDGRKALVIGSLPEQPGDPNDEGYFVPRMVWIESTRNHLFGDVFLVTPTGVRCDDTAWRARPSVPELRDPIIRNVKREGWVRLINNNGLPFTASDVVFSDKAAAEAACQRLGGVPAFVTWDA